MRHRMARHCRAEYPLRRSAASLPDLSPCGLFCTYGNVSELESDSWVTVTGILYGEQYKGQEEPRLRVRSVVPAEPIEGYIVPDS